MNSRIAGIAGVLIAILFAGSGGVQAGTASITFTEKGVATASNVFFNSTSPTRAILYTFSGVDSTGRAFNGQTVLATVSNHSIVCTFTGPGGISETGHQVLLVGGASITITAGVGRLYSVATTGSGCAGHGGISFSESETIQGGGGAYNGASGTRSQQLTGITLFSGGGTAFARVTGSATITVP